MLYRPVVSSLRTLLVCLSLFSVTAASAAIPGTTGKIAGTVTIEGTREGLPGVQVFIQGTSQGTVTDLDGHFMIIDVKPGRYTVMMRFVGFAEVRTENVQVIVDKTTTVDAAMREQVFEGEEVVVVAERPMVQVDRTTTTSFVDEAEIASLPVVSIGQIINLQAGVVDGHFRGGRSGEVSYLVNGVPINNPYSNSAAFEVEKNMIAGLEVISGVFNAEYGQALSGVVNIVTKDVPSQWTGSIATEVGGIASGRELEFVERTAEAGVGLRASDFTTVKVPYYEAAGFPGRQDAQISLGGPILREKFGFRFTGRYWYEEGHTIGRRLFAPSDSSMNLNSGSPETWFIASTGDQEFVPGRNERISMNGTLVYKFSPMMKLEYNIIFQDGGGRGSGQQNKYVPDGINKYYFNSQFHLLGLHWTHGATSFSNINYSYIRDKGGSRLYDLPSDFSATNVLDSRLVSSQLAGLEGPNAFDVGGNDLWYGNEMTETHTVLADYTNQLDRVHQVKAGVLARLHNLNNGGFGIEIGPRTNWQPMPSVDIYGRDTLNTRPYEIAAYLQDKMEFRNLIVNAGLRFDLFNPDYDIPVDWTQASKLYIPSFNDAGVATGDSTYNRTAGPMRWQLSPRLGIAFPISSEGVIRFSAGLFFQTPQLSILFTNPHYEVNPASSQTQFGNPALDPERTLHFEIGLQQGLTRTMGLELTLFSKDIRNLTGVEIRRDVLTTNFFVRYINRDVGTSRGITLSLYQRPLGGVSWDIDYTLQFANGTASNPTEAFDRFQSGQEDILTLVRLDWDRRHVLTNSITYAPSPSLAVTLINRYQTGAPYTTIRNFITSYIKNNGDRPASFTSDMRMFYRPSFAKNVNVSLQVDNLFDAMIHYGVYSDTGRGDESVTQEQFRRAGTVVGGVNTLDEYFFNQGWFSAPRRVTLGVRYEF